MVTLTQKWGVTPDENGEEWDFPVFLLLAQLFDCQIEQNSPQDCQPFGSNGTHPRFRSSHAEPTAPFGPYPVSCTKLTSQGRCRVSICKLQRQSLAVEYRRTALLTFRLSVTCKLLSSLDLAPSCNFTTKHPTRTPLFATLSKLVRVELFTLAITGVVCSHTALPPVAVLCHSWHPADRIFADFQCNGFTTRSCSEVCPGRPYPSP